MAFDVQDVINEIEETRSLEPLKKLKKENLVKVAVHYGITPAVGATKSHTVFCRIHAPARTPKNPEGRLY